MKVDLAQAVAALLGSGVVGGLLVSWAREAWRSRQPAVIEQASLAVVAAARDELEEDNRRLRQQIIEERQRHDEDRSRWAAERASFIAEIDTLRMKVDDLWRRAHSMSQSTEEIP